MKGLKGLGTIDWGGVTTYINDANTQDNGDGTKTSKMSKDEWLQLANIAAQLGIAFLNSKQKPDGTMEVTYKEDAFDEDNVKKAGFGGATTYVIAGGALLMITGMFYFATRKPAAPQPQTQTA